MKALLFPTLLSLSTLFLATGAHASDSCCSAEAAPTTAEVGKPAPAFTLPGADGKSHSLSDAKGKITVLEWTNPECPFVIKFDKSGEIQKLQKEITAKGVVWYRINSSNAQNPGAQTVAQAADYNTAHKVAATATLLDPEGTVGKLYGARTTPHIYVINAEGTLVYNGAIDDAPTKASADVAGAKNYVRQAVDEVLAGKAVSTPQTKPYGCGVKYAK